MQPGAPRGRGHGGVLPPGASLEVDDQRVVALAGVYQSGVGEEASSEAGDVDRPGLRALTARIHLEPPEAPDGLASTGGEDEELVKAGVGTVNLDTDGQRGACPCRCRSCRLRNGLAGGPSCMCNPSPSAICQSAVSVSLFIRMRTLYRRSSEDVHARFRRFARRYR